MIKQKVRVLVIDHTFDEKIEEMFRYNWRIVQSSISHPSTWSDEDGEHYPDPVALLVFEKEEN